MPISRVLVAAAFVGLACANGFAAEGPPAAAPAREPVTVAPLPPVREAAPAAVPPASPAESPTAPAENPFWRRPVFWALVALAATIGGFIATILYMRKPERNRLIAALALTGGSAVFIGAAMLAWLL
jgi:hypothetical protein